MGEIIRFEDIKNIYTDQLKPDINLNKEHPEKFIQTLKYIYPENKSLLDEFGIRLRASQWKVQSVEPMILKKHLLRSRDLGFLHLYQQDPGMLVRDVDTIIKRMAKYDAIGVKYKNDEDKYNTSLFGNRAFAYKTKDVASEYETPTNVETTENPSLDVEMLKDCAERVIETFGLESERESIYAKMVKVAQADIDMKAALLEIFKSNKVDNLEYLSTTIDEILENYKKEQGEGLVA